MTLKELALILNTFQTIVIVEETEEGELQDTKVFEDSTQLFIDSIENVLWKPSFYQKKVQWITDLVNIDNEYVFKIKVK